MKLLLVIATAVAVFTGDCQGTTGGIAGKGEAESGRSIPGGPMNQVFAEKDQQLGEKPDFDKELKRIDLANEDHQMKERNISITGESEDLAFANVNKTGDMVMLLGRARYCKRMDGRCLHRNLPCKEGYQESPRGRPYCSSKRRRCCYPVTTPVIATTTEAATTKLSVTTPTAAPTTKLPDVCSESEGFFTVPKSGNQCYKYFTDSARSWSASKTKCREEGLMLAKPEDPLPLRKFIWLTFGNTHPWIGGQGTGTSVEWDRDGTILDSSNSLWWPGYPGTAPSTSVCLVMFGHTYGLVNFPVQPYYHQPCSSTSFDGSPMFALCELVME